MSRLWRFVGILGQAVLLGGALCAGAEKLPPDPPTPADLETSNAAAPMPLPVRVLEPPLLEDHQTLEVSTVNIHDDDERLNHDDAPPPAPRSSKPIRKSRR